MRWNRRGRRSINVEDRRGRGGGIPGGPFGAAAGLGGIGTIIALLIGLFSGGGVPDLGELGTGSGSADVQDRAPYQPSAEEADRQELSEVVFANAELFWEEEVFDPSGLDYENATLVFYDSPTRTGCGVGSPQMGPFYCGADQRIYLELGFIDELRQRFGASGDFAWAYVVAHEVAHHVQNQLGISSDVIRESQRNPRRRNELSVRQELQADCFSGVWANALATEGDVRDEAGIEIDRSDFIEALEAAAAVGDDRIQEAATGRIDPEGWTHGSAEQRQAWFSRGFDSGNPQDCDTFGVSYDSL